jgi:hypothetical protein
MLVPICHSMADVISASGVDWTLDSVQVTSRCGSAIEIIDVVRFVTYGADVDTKKMD